MSNIEEEYAAMAKEKFSNMGKEPNIKLETPKTEEKTGMANTEGEKTEQPKRRKTLSVYITRRMQATAEREEERREKENPLVRRRPETDPAAAARPAQPAGNQRPAQPRPQERPQQAKPEEGSRPVQTGNRPAAPARPAQPAKPASCAEPRTVTAETAATTEMRPRTEIAYR